MNFLTGRTGGRARLGLELTPIRVNTIGPGFIDTDFWDVLPAATVEEIRAKVRANLPVRRRRAVGRLDVLTSILRRLRVLRTTADSSAATKWSE